MKIIHEECAGIDAHKKTAVTTVRKGEDQTPRTFGTMTSDLLALSDWLLLEGITHVAIESTGEFWKPIYNILESNFEVILVNAQHIKQVPGRKTEVKDAEWLAELLQQGLLKPRFIPPIAQRELGDLTRYRSTFIRERATVVNRVQKVLEDANIKLASVASDVMGVAGRAMLDALVAGASDPATLADLAKGKLREKQDQLVKALDGRMKPHHQFVLAELLGQIDSLEAVIARFNEHIQQACVPFEPAVVILDTIPGVARQAADTMVAEMGVDMSRFPSADHLSAWAGVAPGNYESAGKRKSGKTRKGNRVLRTILVQAAHAATRTKGTYLSALYRRIAARRGKKKAILAVAHAILVSAYYMLLRMEPYREVGSQYFDQIRPEQTAKRLVKHLERLGFSVTLQSPTARAAA